MRSAAAALALALLVGCSGRGLTGPRPCHAEPGSATDLSSEPDWWSPGVQRFSDRNGCFVRLDVLMLFSPTPEFHCGRWPDRISMGTPLGRPMELAERRVYVRDARRGFARDAVLPREAVDSGSRTTQASLWTVPGDEAFIYLRYFGRTERWPRELPVRACM